MRDERTPKDVCREAKDNQARQVTEVGQDKKVGQDTQARQVTEVP